ncbi:MAG: hypothetical protein RLZ14_1343 [Actinomycetota bacterium]|jgi:hypothetical protein
MTDKDRTTREVRRRTEQQARDKKRSITDYNKQLQAWTSAVLDLAKEHAPAIAKSDAPTEMVGKGAKAVAGWRVLQADDAAGANFVHVTVTGDVVWASTRVMRVKSIEAKHTEAVVKFLTAHGVACPAAPPRP